MKVIDSSNIVICITTLDTILLISFDLDTKESTSIK